MEELNRRLTWEEFEQDWLKRHKRSLPRPRKVSAWGLIGGLLVWAAILIATSALSGAHSIPVVQETIRVYGIVSEQLRQAVSVLGFLMLEGTIFASAAHKSSGRYAKAALYFSLTATIAANLYSTIHAVAAPEAAAVPASLIVVGVNVLYVLKVLTATILGVGAPLTAYLAGEMVARLFEKFEERQTIAAQEYETAKKKVDVDINTAYTRYTKEYDEKLVQAQERLSVRTESVPSTNGYDTDQGVRTEYVPSMIPGTASTRTGVPSKAVRDLADVLKQNPDDLQLSAAKIRAKYGTGQGVANDAKNLAKAEMNGG